jgi:hypothetical protein
MNLDDLKTKESKDVSNWPSQSQPLAFVFFLS